MNQHNVAFCHNSVSISRNDEASERFLLVEFGLVLLSS